MFFDALPEVSLPNADIFKICWRCCVCVSAARDYSQVFPFSEMTIRWWESGLSQSHIFKSCSLTWLRSEKQTFPLHFFTLGDDAVANFNAFYKLLQQELAHNCKDVNYAIAWEVIFTLDFSLTLHKLERKHATQLK